MCGLHEYNEANEAVEERGTDSDDHPQRLKKDVSPRLVYKVYSSMHLYANR